MVVVMVQCQGESNGVLETSGNTGRRTEAGSTTTEKGKTTWPVMPFCTCPEHGQLKARRILRQLKVEVVT
jgi:hypothetical protein